MKVIMGKMGKTVILPLAAFALVILLLVGPISVSAVDQYTSTYLLDMYYKARADLLGLLASYKVTSTASGPAVNSTPESESGNTTTSTGTTSTTVTETGSGTETLANETTTEGTSQTTTENSGSTTTLSTPTETESEMGFCSHIEQEVDEIISEADGYAAAADANLQAGNYRQAAHLALKALNTIGKAYVHLTICLNNAASSEAGRGNENATAYSQTNTSTTANGSTSKIPPGLLSALLRHKIRLSRLKAVIKAAEESGINVSTELNATREIEGMLNQSEELLLNGDVKGAVKLMEEANKLMSELVRSLRTSSIEALAHRHKGGKGENVTEKAKVKVTKSPEGHGKGLGKGNKTLPTQAKEHKGEKEHKGDDEGSNHSGKGGKKAKRP